MIKFQLFEKEATSYPEGKEYLITQRIHKLITKDGMSYEQRPHLGMKQTQIIKQRSHLHNTLKLLAECSFVTLEFCGPQAREKREETDGWEVECDCVIGVKEGSNTGQQHSLQAEAGGCVFFKNLAIIVILSTI